MMFNEICSSVTYLQIDTVVLIVINRLYVTLLTNILYRYLYNYHITHSSGVYEESGGGSPTIFLY